MQVYYGLDELPSFAGTAVTIGTFDGVHPGHRKILSRLVSIASRNMGRAVLITFNPHPRQLLGNKDQQISLLTTESEKLHLLEQCGLSNVVIVPFTREFAEQSAESYIENFLVKKFSPAAVVVGYDHRYGKNRSGDLDLLQKFSAANDFVVEEIPAHLVDAAAISSTRIRQYIKSGNIEAANEGLGYTYSFAGMVSEGKKLGRTIGYPTANVGLIAPEKLLPANGVYAVLAKVASDGNFLKGMMNIGTRPTVNGASLSVEVNLFDFADDIYGKEIRVYVIKRLRDEQKFNGLDALKLQLNNDEITSRKILAEINAPAFMQPG